MHLENAHTQNTTGRRIAFFKRGVLNFLSEWQHATSKLFTCVQTALSNPWFMQVLYSLFSVFGGECWTYPIIPPV